jgi:SAM-dependent methyltransferase
VSVLNGDSGSDPAADHPCEPWYAPDEIVRGILSTVPPQEGHRVLVVGCGSEDPSRRLAEETGAEVLNIDVHPTGPALPLGGESVDQVWCLGATTHVEDLPRFAEDVTRVLRSGGRALVADTFWDGFRPPRFADLADQPWHAVATKSVVSLLSRCGLTDVEVLPWPSPSAPVARNGAGEALAEDLADGRLSPALVLARKP